MTRDEIIRMAQEVGYCISIYSESLGVTDVESIEIDELGQLERFAALVAAAEREACANVCEQARDDEWAYSEEWAVLDGCLAGIRARGAA